AATPSNAAELVVDRADNFLTRIDRATARLAGAMDRVFDRRAAALDRADQRLERWPVIVAMRDRDREQLGLRRAHARAGRSGRAGCVGVRRGLDERDVRGGPGGLRTRRARAAGGRRGRVERRRLPADARAREPAARLDALSPIAVLARGYAVCWNETRTS